jgi:hypothetical protein
MGLDDLPEPVRRQWIDVTAFGDVEPRFVEGFSGGTRRVRRHESEHEYRAERLAANAMIMEEAERPAREMFWIVDLILVFLFFLYWVIR